MTQLYRHYSHLFTVLIGCLLATSACWGEIIEIKHIKDIQPYITSDTLCVFDLDNTVVENRQALGSDQWFEAKLKQNIREGRPIEEALPITLSTYHTIVMRTKVQPVEPIISDFIKTLQQNHQTLALTARDTVLEQPTLEQLSSLGISFNHGHNKDHRLFSGTTRHLVSSGIIFANGDHKGNCLADYLKYLKWYPKRIVFIDDKLKNLQHVEAAIKNLNIEYFGFRYGYLDDKVKSFDMRIADIQLEKFHDFLTNDEASALLNHRHAMAEAGNTFG